MTIYRKVFEINKYYTDYECISFTKKYIYIFFKRLFYTVFLDIKNRVNGFSGKELSDN